MMYERERRAKDSTVGLYLMEALMDKTEGFNSIEEELKKLKLENKKLIRANARLKKDCEFLNGLKEQISRTQDYIQKENLKQNFYNTQLLNTYPYPLIMVNRNMITVMASKPYYDHSIYGQDDITEGVPLEDALVGLLSREQIRQLIFKCNNVLTNRKERSLLIEFMYDGEMRSFQININSMIQDGEVFGLNIMFVDMTEVVNAMEKAEAADRAKSNFLANMSHEIRTPMNVISGMAEFIIRDSKDAEAKKNASMIKSASKSLLSIINDILDFSKIESGKLEIIEGPYHFPSMINDIATMIRVRLQDKDVALTLDIDKSTPSMLFGDEIRVKQVLINLLNNAVKFTNEGMITLTSECKKIDDENCRLTFRIKDTGIGIKKEDIKKIFNSFTQVDTTRNRTVEGTGLGLAISRRLVDMMDGTLNVESVYGEGSVFTFDIITKVEEWEPMGELAESIKKVKQRAFQVTFTAPDCRVLVVDDNVMNLKVAEGVLKPYDINIDCAKSGAEAIECFEENDYDIIFMDHMMPVMDGVETMKRIRSMEGGDRVVIVALTANAISGVRAKYVKEGFNDFLAKPIGISAMDDLLKEYIPPDLKKPATRFGTAFSEDEDTDEYDEEYYDEESYDEDDIIDSLSHIRYLNVKTGMEYCMNSEDFYVMMLEEYINNSKVLELNEYFENKDWENYKIVIHSVKSTSLNIGAERLSDDAKALEIALNDNNSEYVEVHHEETIEEYVQLLEEIERLL